MMDEILDEMKSNMAAAAKAANASKPNFFMLTSAAFIWIAKTAYEFGLNDWKLGVLMAVIWILHNAKTKR